MTDQTLPDRLRAAAVDLDAAEPCDHSTLLRAAAVELEAKAVQIAALEAANASLATNAGLWAREPGASKGRIDKATAAHLADTCDPLCLVLDFLESAQAQGWPRFYAVMETTDGNTAELTSRGGLSEAMTEVISETLDGRGSA